MWNCEELRPCWEWLGYWWTAGLLGVAGIVSRLYFADAVSEALGDHNTRAIVEHSMEGAVLPLALMGLVWCSQLHYDRINWGRVRNVGNAVLGLVIPVYLAAQLRLELEQAAILSRPLQVEQLVGTLAGAAVGLVATLAVDRFGKKMHGESGGENHG